MTETHLSLYVHACGKEHTHERERERLCERAQINACKYKACTDRITNVSTNIYNNERAYRNISTHKNKLAHTKINYKKIK